MWSFSPNNNNSGNAMDFNIMMQFVKFLEEREKAIKDGAKPKDDKKTGDYWRNFCMLMFLTVPLSLIYFLVATYFVVMIVKTTKGL